MILKKLVEKKLLFIKMINLNLIVIFKVEIYYLLINKLQVKNIIF